MTQTLSVTLSDCAVTAVALSDSAVVNEQHDLQAEATALIAAMVPKPNGSRRLLLDAAVVALFADPGFVDQTDVLVDAMTDHPAFARLTLINATVEELLA